MKIDKVGTHFHEKLQLSSSRLSQVLSALATHPKATFNELRELTSLGTNMVKAFPRLGEACGMITPRRELTKLGRKVVDSDPNLTSISTLWSAHYHLVSEEGPGPEFWGLAFRNVLKLGTPMSVADISKEVAEELGSDNAQPQSIRDATSRMLGFYAASDGLGGLALIQNPRSSLYEIRSGHEEPSVGALGYMVALRWLHLYGERSTIDLDEFLMQSNLTSVLKVSHADLRSQVEHLAAAGLCDLYTSHPPFQIVRTWSSPTEFIERMYD